MATNKNKEKILKEYEEKTEKILSRMFNVLARAHRKVDEEAYRLTLEKLQK